MSRRAFKVLLVSVLAFTASVALTTSARAATWVSLGEAEWIDRDSIRRNGDWVTFNWDLSPYWLGINGPPAASSSGVPKFYNCATHHFGNVVDGQIFDDGGFGGSTVLEPARAAVYAGILCT